jgi:hypothetical protein
VKSIQSLHAASHMGVIPKATAGPSGVCAGAIGGAVLGAVDHISGDVACESHGLIRFKGSSVGTVKDQVKVHIVHLENLLPWFAVNSEHHLECKTAGRVGAMICIGGSPGG